MTVQYIGSIVAGAVFTALGVLFATDFKGIMSRATAWHVEFWGERGFLPGAPKVFPYIVLGLGLFLLVGSIASML
jgi:hypothetical protein